MLNNYRRIVLSPNFVESFSDNPIHEAVAASLSRCETKGLLLTDLNWFEFANGTKLSQKEKAA